MASPGNQKIQGGSRWAFLWLLVVLAIVTAIRIRLADMPLERDEGEFAYGGQLMLQGVSIYKEAYNDALKLPGTCAIYALAMASFGQTATGIHTAVILTTLATAILTFFLMRRIGGDGAGVVAAGTYALLSITPPSFGLAAHATHFVMLPAVAGIYLLQNVDERTRATRIFFAGLLLGVAIVMKQTGAMFGIFGAAWMAHREFIFPEKDYRRLAMRLGLLALGGVLPFLFTCDIIALEGDWPQFWLWTFKYAAAHAEIISFMQGMQTAAGVAGQLFLAAPALWSFALAGIIWLFCEAALRPWRFFILGFVVFSFAAVYPGWRGHYFIQAFPAAALLGGVAFFGARSALARWKVSLLPQLVLFLIFCAALASPLVQWDRFYFTLTPAESSRALYRGNPFPESVEIGRYLEAHCSPDARVAVLGSEPQIYFYSHRRAATGYISMYPLVEPQPYAAAMQQQMVEEIENSNPEYVVFVHVPGSWLRYSDAIQQWFQQYQSRQLQLVGLVEVSPDGPPVYHWFNGDETAVQSSSPLWITIFKRR